MRAKTLLTVVVFLLLPLTVMAKDNKENLMAEVYAKSGLEKQMAQFPMLIQLGFDQAVATDGRLQQMPRQVLAEMRDAIKIAFAPEKIKKTILTQCREKLRINDLKHVLGWLNSPLGRKFTRLEESASTPEKYKEIQQYALRLQKNPPLPERLNIVQQLDSTVKATETGVEVALRTQAAIAMAAVAALPREQRPTFDKLVSAIAQNRAQIENSVRNQTLVSFLFIYEKVPIEQIRQYVAFASQAAGVNYHQATLAGLKRALTEGAYNWGELIFEILKKSKTRIET